MSDKPKSLRQFLSKSKVNQPPKESVDQLKEKEIPSNKENIENNTDKEKAKAIESDIDPLKFFEQAKEPIPIPVVPQTSFLDLITNALEEKKEAEKAKEEEELKKKDAENEEEDTPVSIIARVQSKKKKPEENKEPIKPIENKEPTKLLGSLNKKIDEKELLKQLEDEDINEELKDEPQKLEKLDLPELDDNKKKRLMARMTSAKQGVNKLILGKALLQMASAGLIDKKAKDDDQLNLKQFHQIVSTDLKNTFVLNDPDVQRIYENESVKAEIKNVDFSIFMNTPKNPNEKKEKKNIKDIILGKKKQNPPQKPPEQP